MPPLVAVIADRLDRVAVASGKDVSEDWYSEAETTYPIVREMQEVKELNSAGVKTRISHYSSETLGALGYVAGFTAYGSGELVAETKPVNSYSTVTVD